MNKKVRNVYVSLPTTRSWRVSPLTNCEERWDGRVITAAAPRLLWILKRHDLFLSAIASQTLGSDASNNVPVWSKNSTRQRRVLGSVWKFDAACHSLFKCDVLCVLPPCSPTSCFQGLSPPTPHSTPHPRRSSTSLLLSLCVQKLYGLFGPTVYTRTAFSLHKTENFWIWPRMCFCLRTPHTANMESLVKMYFSVPAGFLLATQSE